MLAKKIKKTKHKRNTSKLKNKTLIGIDQSLNGLGMCVMRNNKVVNYLFVTSTKKHLKNKHSIYLNIDKSLGVDRREIERMLFLEKLLCEIIYRWRPHYVAFEGYAYNARGHQIQIGELGGVLRRILYINNTPFRVYDPLTVKMFATGSGKAEKQDVTNAMEKKYGVDFSSISSYDKNKKRKIGIGSDGDICDAISIAGILTSELEVRYGDKTISNTNDIVRKILNRTTKRNPENLLFRDFIIKDKEWWKMENGTYLKGEFGSMAKEDKLTINIPKGI